jgi:hypothetical protein
MERSLRIRLGLAAPILGFFYFYLLVLLIGWTSSAPNCGNGTRNSAVAASGYLAARLEQPPHFLRHRSHQAAYCRAVGSLVHPTIVFSRRNLDDRFTATSLGELKD